MGIFHVSKRYISKVYKQIKNPFNFNYKFAAAVFWHFQDVEAAFRVLYGPFGVTLRLSKLLTWMFRDDARFCVELLTYESLTPVPRLNPAHLDVPYMGY